MEPPLGRVRVHRKTEAMDPPKGRLKEPMKMKSNAYFM